VTFGAPMPLAEWDKESRRDTLKLAKITLETIGRLYKVLPSAIVATVVRPSIGWNELTDRVAEVVETLVNVDANMDSTDPDVIVPRGIEVLEARGIVVPDADVLRVRERHALRYYARTIEHLLPPPGHTARTTDAGRPVEELLPRAGRQRGSEDRRLEVRPAQR
jgi:hypothetical protein